MYCFSSLVNKKKKNIKLGQASQIIRELICLAAALNFAPWTFGLSDSNWVGSRYIMRENSAHL